MDTSNWRGQLSPETRGRFCTEILEKLGILKSGRLSADGEELLELRKIAQSIEQKSYAGATSMCDYRMKIISKLDLMQNATAREKKNQLNQLTPDFRQRMVQKIMDTLRRHLPVSGEEGLHELRKIAQRFEEKIFTAATSQSDYLRKISMKMLTMETKSQGPLGNNLPSNQVGPSNRPHDPEEQ